LIFICLSVEFLGFLLLIVYVGAISILFLFVVMLLDVRLLELHNTFLNYFSITFFFGLILGLIIFFLLSFHFDYLGFSKLVLRLGGDFILVSKRTIYSYLGNLFISFYYIGLCCNLLFVTGVVGCIVVNIS
jgi:NADH-quinone oxidoreductase subunit J